MKRIQLMVVLAMGCGFTANVPAQSLTPGGSLSIFKETRDEYWAPCASTRATACDQLLQGYQRAAEAHDATADTRHAMLKYIFEAYYLRSKIEVEQRRYKEAIAILTPALEQMREHNADGKHFHVLIDGQGVMREMIMALHGDRRRADADSLTETARAATDKVWSAYDRLKDSEAGRKMLQTAAMEGERLERRLGDNLATMHENRRMPPVDMNLSRSEIEPRLMEAYMRAAEWLLRKDELGVAGAIDEPPQIRFATYKNWTGWLLAKAGKKEEAANEYLASASAVCDMIDRTENKTQGIGAFWADEGKPLCNEARSGYFEATMTEAERAARQAELQKMFDAAFERWYAEQLKLLEQDELPNSPFVR